MHFLDERVGRELWIGEPPDHVLSSMPDCRHRKGSAYVRRGGPGECEGVGGCRSESCNVGKHGALCQCDASGAARALFACGKLHHTLDTCALAPVYREIG